MRRRATFAFQRPSTHLNSSSLNHVHLLPLVNLYFRCFNTIGRRIQKENWREGSRCRARTEETEGMRVMSPTVRSFIFRLVSFSFPSGPTSHLTCKNILNCKLHPTTSPSHGRHACENRDASTCAYRERMSVARSRSANSHRSHSDQAHIRSSTRQWNV